MDALAGGLLMLGLVMWGVRVVRRRDAVLWLLPVTALVMLLPSAMTLAYTDRKSQFHAGERRDPRGIHAGGAAVGTLCWRATRPGAASDRGACRRARCWR